MPSKKSYKHRAKPPEERAISSRTRRGGKKKEVENDKGEEEEDVQKETPKKPESAGLLQTGANLVASAAIAIGSMFSSQIKDVSETTNIESQDGDTGTSRGTSRLQLRSRVGEKLENILGNKGVTETNTSSMVLFPTSHGLGFAATLLLHHLVDEHNTIIKAYAEANTIQLNLVTCSEILDCSMLVAVDAQDLHLALVANSECNFGLEDSEVKNARWTINEHGLEQQIIDRFLSGKPLIDKSSIPLFEYRLDNFTTNRCVELRAKICQLDSLPSAAIGAKLESELPEIRDVSSLLDILHTTADILAKVGGNQKDSLIATIKKLKIISFKSKSFKESFLKSLDNFTLGHLEQLMLKLRFVRAKRMVCNNQSPFDKAQKSFRQQLPPVLIRSIDKIFHIVQPEVLATELLDFIHVVIDVGGDSNEADLAEKKMSDYFSEFLFEKDVHNMDHILPHIDPEIKLKHCISFFTVIAKKIQDRN